MSPDTSRVGAAWMRRANAVAGCAGRYAAGTAGMTTTTTTKPPSPVPCVIVTAVERRARRWAPGRKARRGARDASTAGELGTQGSSGVVFTACRSSRQRTASTRARSAAAANDHHRPREAEGRHVTFDLGAAPPTVGAQACAAFESVQNAARERLEAALDERRRCRDAIFATTRAASRV